MFWWNVFWGFYDRKRDVAKQGFSTCSSNFFFYWNYIFRKFLFFATPSHFVFKYTFLIERLHSSSRHQFLSLFRISHSSFSRPGVTCILLDGLPVYLKSGIHGFHYIRDMHSFLVFCLRKVNPLIGRSEERRVGKEC